jgi:hypothetical protein
VKVIFSRKGFDSSSGGCPSPILEGQPLSLPIPTSNRSPTRYGDLTGPYAELVTALTRGRLDANSWCHFDPDLVAACLPRLPGWRGALGQAGSSQGHLERQKLAPGDLFVFWGLFQDAERRSGEWRFVGSAEHRIWGWLQVGEIIDLGSDGSFALAKHPWLRDHPHTRPYTTKKNTLYIAADQLVIDGTRFDLAGSGTLARGRRLSVRDALKSIWTVPDWLNPTKGGCGMTYHPLPRWSEDGTLRSAARGQEFVAQPKDDAAWRWLAAVLKDEQR